MLPQFFYLLEVLQGRSVVRFWCRDADAGFASSTACAYEEHSYLCSATRWFAELQTA